jgi:hypothetical protein
MFLQISKNQISLSVLGAFSVCEPRLPTFRAALKTPEGILVIVGLVTCGAIFWQAWETRKAAEAARSNIQAFIATERAWLIPSDTVTPKGLPTIRSQPTQEESMIVRIQNFGHTPAWLTDWFLRAEVLEDTNIGQFLSMQKPEGDHPNARPFPPNKIEDFRVSWEINDQSEIDDIQSGKKHLYVYGYLEYGSTVGKAVCHSYFCFHYFRLRDSLGHIEEGWMIDPPEGNYYT